MIFYFSGVHEDYHGPGDDFEKIMYNKTAKVGKLVSIMEVVDEDDIIIITNKGIMIRQPVESIKVIGRNTQGVKLLRLDDGAFISSITKVLNEDEESENEDEEGGESADETTTSEE